MSFVEKKRDSQEQLLCITFANKSIQTNSDELQFNTEKLLLDRMFRKRGFPLKEEKTQGFSERMVM